MAAMFIVAPLTLQAQTRVVENFDFDWKFSRIELSQPDRGMPEGQRPEMRPMGPPHPRVDEILDSEKGLEAVAYDDSGWETVQAPHDWNIKDKFDVRNSSGSAASLPEGIGWYRKTFSVPSKMKGKNVTVLFDGIFQKSDVWVNGHHLGTHPYGYSSVYYDITPYIEYGKENLIAVRSSTVGGRPRWYGGGGLYRHIDLIYTDPVHVDVYGTYVTTPEVSSSKARISVATTLVNSSEKESRVTLSQSVVDAAGKVVAKSAASAVIASGAKADVSVEFDLAGPHLWDIDDPYMYSLETTVKSGGKTVDVYTTPFGVRTFEFDPDKGFSLNGKHIKLQGMAIHQDAGALGTGVPDRAYERRLEIMKEYGVNAIRMAHNQPSRELLDMCDRFGFLVIDEALDKWKSGYYEALFDEWWQKDLGDMILRDRNHPSIILWSIGNEVTEAWLENDEGVERAAMLQDFVHQLDPTRPVCLAAQNNHQAKFAGVTDVIGYNYLEARAISEHAEFPQRKMLITEELPYWRGEEGNIRAYTELNPWELVRNNDFFAGGFIWSGVDYLGEASEPSKGWPNGLFDICMFEKPRASYHRAMWSDRPVVRVAVRDSGLDQDHGRDIWQWPATKDDWTYPMSMLGRMMTLETVTNCEEVELYVGDKLMGRRSTADYPNNTIIWNIPYMPGTVTAKGYNGGELADEHSIYTAREISEICVEADKDEISADGQDLSHLTITLKDADGHRVQVDDRYVSVVVQGSGRLLAVESGELRVPEDSFDRTSVKTQYGRALAIVQSLRTAGTMTVTVFAEGLDPVSVNITAK